MEISLVDSHCHLDFDDFGTDMEAVLARAKESGVERMLTICTRVTKFDQVLAIAMAHDNIRCTVGIHPHEAENEPDVDVAKLVELSKHPRWSVSARPASTISMTRVRVSVSSKFLPRISKPHA